MRVEKWKWPQDRTSGRPRITWEAHPLAEDEYGAWLYCPAGARHHRDDGTVTVLPCDGVQLLPRDGWWAAWWWADERWIGVDVGTRPERHGPTWSYVDLELDLVQLADGSVLCVDEDEFAEAVGSGRIPPDVAAHATASAARLGEMMRLRREPFGEAGWRLLAAAAARRGDGAPRTPGV